MSRALAILLLALAVQGCGSSERSLYGVRVVYDQAITPQQRAVFDADVAAVVSAWEADFGQQIEPLTVEVTLDLARCQNTSANGCAFLAERHVLVYPQNHLHQLYHELCHVGLQLADHSDPRWPAWDLRGSSILPAGP